jgi:hypothetical protein
LRNQIVETLELLVETENVALDALLSWLDSLASVSSDPLGLSSDTKILIAKLAIRFLERARVLNVPFESFSYMSEIVDLVMDTDGTNVAALELSRVYTNFVMLDIVTGQNRVDVIGSMFKASFLTASNLDGNSLSIVSTPVEELTGAATQSASWHSPLSDSVIISLTESRGNSSTFNNLPLGLKFSQFPCNNSMTNKCSFDVTLQRNSARSYRENALPEDVTHTVKCEDNITAAHNFSCPHGEDIVLLCNGTRGYIAKRCPTMERVPTCAVMDLSPSSCTTVQYTDHNITCRCVVDSPSGRRRLQSSPDSGEDTDDSAVSLEYGVVLQTVLTDFTETWASAGSLSAGSVADSIQVLITVAVLGALGLVAVVGSSQLDKRDEMKFAKVSTAVKNDSGNDKEPFSASTARQVHPHDDCETGQQAVRSATPPHVSRGQSLHVLVAGAIVGRLSRVFSVVNMFLTENEADPTTVSDVVVVSELKKLEDSLPLVLRPVSLVKKFTNEIKVYHRFADCNMLILFFSNNTHGSFVLCADGLVLLCTIPPPIRDI